MTKCPHLGVNGLHQGCTALRSQQKAAGLEPTPSALKPVVSLCAAEAALVHPQALISWVVLGSLLERFPQYELTLFSVFVFLHQGYEKRAQFVMHHLPHTHPVQTRLLPRSPLPPPFWSSYSMTMSRLSPDPSTSFTIHLHSCASVYLTVYVRLSAFLALNFPSRSVFLSTDWSSPTLVHLLKVLQIKLAQQLEGVTKLQNLHFEMWNRKTL